MKTETGVMIVKGGKGFGLLYDDGQVSEYGWMDMEDAPIRDPKFCKNTTGVIAGRQLARHKDDLLTAKLVNVERVTTTTVIEP